MLCGGTDAGGQRTALAHNYHRWWRSCLPHPSGGRKPFLSGFPASDTYRLVRVVQNIYKPNWVLNVAHLLDSSLQWLASWGGPCGERSFGRQPASRRTRRLDELFGAGHIQRIASAIGRKWSTWCISRDCSLLVAFAWNNTATIVGELCERTEPRLYLKKKNLKKLLINFILADADHAAELLVPDGQKQFPPAYVY